jgi:hypothetical protein
MVLQRGQAEMDTIAIANQEAEFSRQEQTAEVFEDLVDQLGMIQMAEDAAEVEVGQVAEGTREEARKWSLKWGLTRMICLILMSQTTRHHRGKILTPLPPSAPT